MQLPQFQGSDQTFQLMQNKWAAILNPFIASPSNQSSIIKNIVLQTGNNVINHLLNQPLQGYRIIMKGNDANVYDAQSSNQTPQTTLILVTNKSVTISIEVF